MSKRSTLTSPRISCVMPAYNESSGLAPVVERVLAVLKTLSPAVEILIVNDGSRDNTAAVARALCQVHTQVKLLELSRNFGKEAALTAGLEEARGDVVVIMDADGQHPETLLPDMLDKWRTGYDVVYAVRRTRQDQSRLHRRLVGWFYRLVNFGNRVKIPAGAGDFRLLDRRVVQALCTLPERHRFMKGLYAWVGFPSISLDYDPLEREGGQSHFGLRGAFGLGVTGLLAFSSTPLRAVGVLGLVLSLLALGYGASVIVEFFWLGIDVPGHATQVVGMMLLGGVQLTSIGLLAEYVSRIYDEVKQRPIYLLASKEGHGLDAERQGHVKMEHASAYDRSTVFGFVDEDERT